jgi:hypothetical protein
VRKGSEERLSPVVSRRKGKNRGATLTGEENWSGGGTAWGVFCLEAAVGRVLIGIEIARHLAH